MSRTIFTNSTKEKYNISISSADRNNYGNNPSVRVEMYNEEGFIQPEITPIKKTENDENEVISIEVFTSKREGQIIIG